MHGKKDSFAAIKSCRWLDGGYIGASITATSFDWSYYLQNHVVVEHKITKHYKFVTISNPIQYCVNHEDNKQHLESVGLLELGDWMLIRGTYPFSSNIYISIYLYGCRIISQSFRIHHSPTYFVFVYHSLFHYGTHPNWQRFGTHERTHIKLMNFITTMILPILENSSKLRILVRLQVFRLFCTMEMDC